MGCWTLFFFNFQSNKFAVRKEGGRSRKSLVLSHNMLINQPDHIASVGIEIPLTQVGLLSVTVTSLCSRYWLHTANSFDLVCEG